MKRTDTIILHPLFLSILFIEILSSNWFFHAFDSSSNHLYYLSILFIEIRTFVHFATSICIQMGVFLFSLLRFDAGVAWWYQGFWRSFYSLYWDSIQEYFIRLSALRAVDTFYSLYWDSTVSLNTSTTTLFIKQLSILFIEILRGSHPTA